MSKFTLETHFRVYDESDGSHIHVGLDGETDCCLIAWIDGAKTQFEAFLADDQVELLIKALEGYLATRPKP